MQQSGNTILITGGGSGIGRALAEAFHTRGNDVIIASRRRAVLDEVTAANPGMKSKVLDIADAASIDQLASDLERETPALNVVIHAAGIMRAERVQRGALADAEETVATNLLGPIRLNAALLPQIERRPNATVMTVSSGLAFVPLALTPTYSATKAAIHSYTQSLRFQLRNSGVQVIELIPPYVQTELMSRAQAVDPNAMPLRDFISEVMSLLERHPDATEVCVDRVQPLRTAPASGEYPAFFQQFNHAMEAAL